MRSVSRFSEHRNALDQANFRVLPFNITHLYRREGLLDCFDRISTTQAENDTPLLVFFDEINAELGGDPEEDSIKLERVYLAASLLKAVFPEIEFIAEDVLDLFARLPENFSTRRVTQLASNFSNVRRRRIASENIPWGWIMESSDGSMRPLRKEWEGSWHHRRDSVREIRLIAERR